MPMSERKLLERARDALSRGVEDMRAGCVLADIDAYLKEPVQDGWPKLEKPAKVIGTFGVGVSSRLVVEAAQRAYEYDGERKSKTPEQWREDERARRELWAAINGPLDDPEPAQDEHKALADAIHWPDCWDTAAYPTLASALSEVVASFRCTNQDTHTQDERKALAEKAKDLLWSALIAEGQAAHERAGSEEKKAAGDARKVCEAAIDRLAAIPKGNKP